MGTKTVSMPVPTKKKDDTQKETQTPTKVTQAPPKETEVTRWLKKNDAGEYATGFNNKGFYYIKDITDEDLKDLIPDEKSGIRSMLSRLVREEKEKTDPEIPKLPEGTKWDLTSKELELPDGMKFEIPNALQVPKDDKVVVSPGSMTPEEWMVVARNSCLLYGRRMDGVEPATAAYPILRWKVPKGNNFMRSEHLAAEVKSELTYTETSSNYVRQGFSKINATLAVPYCAASVEREDNEKHAASAKTKQLFMSGIWNFPRAKVLLEECSDVSPQFVDEIRKIVGVEPDPFPNLGERRKEMGLVEERQPWGQNEPTSKQVQEWATQKQARRQAAEKAIVAIELLLLRYGHIVGWNVDVGGRLFFVYHKQMTGDINTHEQKATTGAAVGIKTSPGFGVSAEVGVKVGEGTANKQEALYIAESVTFTALGGDTTLASNPQAWASTVKDPNLWAVINIAEAKSTIDLLPELLRGFVKQLWKKYGRRGTLDGCAGRLKAYPDGPYLAMLGDWVGISSVHGITADINDPIWNIGCFHDNDAWGNMYFLQDKNSGRAMGGDMSFVQGGGRLPGISVDPQHGLTGQWRAGWHIHPVDPEGVYGDQFRDCYLLEPKGNGLLLMLSDQKFYLAELPHSDFSLSTKYAGVPSPIPNSPFLTILREDKTNGSISPTQLVWKLELVNDE